jgi:dTDP-4-amino-4,6-dideoxygalactose transaminase
MDRAFLRYQEEIEAAALAVLRGGRYVLGERVREFEENFAAYTGARYCVGLASGLDALWIACRILGIGAGDEVIVPANTYIASVMGITICGATPVLVEPDAYYCLDPDRIEAAITPKTKAILPVHLYGQAADMEAIMQIARKHGLKVVEDCAQSHGVRQNGKMTGTFGEVGCFSFYPTKNLGAYGEAGCIVTDDEGLAEQFRVFRNYGSEKRY